MTNKDYILPKTVEVISVLDDSMLGEYNESVKSCNEKARETLGKFNTNNEILTGSSSFMNLQLSHLNSENPGVFINGMKLATRRDLEKAIVRDNNFLSGFYTDFGLALKSAEDPYKPNDLLAKKLASQLKERDIIIGSGKLIPFSALAKPREHNESAYGLVFDLRNDIDTKDIKNLILDLDEFSWNYIRDCGLSRACLDYGRSWDYFIRELAVSDSNGRVVGVGVEEALKNLGLGYSN